MFTHEEVMMTSAQRRQMAEKKAVSIWLSLTLAAIAGVLVGLIILVIVNHKNGDWFFSWWLGLSAGGCIVAIAPAYIYFTLATWHLPPNAS